jgi:hypothetical protein
MNDGGKDFDYELKEKINYGYYYPQSKILPQPENHHHPQTLVPGELPTGLH